MMDQGPKVCQAPSAPLEEWRQRAAGRSNVYGLLALVFRDTPTPEIVAQLRSPPLAEALSRLGYDVAEELGGELEGVADRLGEEYTRLFVGPGPCASPYASVHHEDEGRLWGDSTVRAKRFIEHTGLAIEGAWDSIPDHVAIALEVMQRLAGHEATLWAQAAAPTHGAEHVQQELARCLQAEAEFLCEHLSAWAPGFCDRVAEESTAPFYREMARLTKAFLLSDNDEIEAARRALRPE